MGLVHNKPNGDLIPGFYEPVIDFKLTKNHHNNPYYYIQDFLTDEDVVNLINLFDSATVREQVSIQGLKDVECGIGSERTTMWSEELATMLTQKLLNSSINHYYTTNEFSKTDSWQNVPTAENTWQLVGFSPLLRFMSYLNGGEHYAHYDAGYIYPDSDYRTLKSVVIYLTTNHTGATRFISDGQDDIKQCDRVNLDWSREVNRSEVDSSSFPKAKNMLIFDHRMCHDVSKFIPEFEGERRIIIRGDLIYKRI